MMRLQLQASSVSAGTTGAHPNKLEFSGTLTRVGVPSDAPPNGSGGKRVLLTKAAAERALPSLPGMAIDMSSDWSSHDRASKVGLMTAARLEGDAIEVSGYFWGSDFPLLERRLVADQGRLGFSFEAERVAVENPDADPLVVTDLVFTGAAVILKDRAAYRNTAILVMTAKQRENLPVGNDLRLAAGADAGGPIAVPRPLLRVMASSGVTSPGDVDRLSEAQLAKMLENRTPGQRMEIKSQVLAAGLYPRGMPTFSGIR